MAATSLCPDTGGGGEEQGPVSFELLVGQNDASGWLRNFRFQVTDGVVDGLGLAHDGTSALDWLATPIPGHRVIYRTNGIDVEPELLLGTLDYPLPARTTRLDAPVKGSEGVLSFPVTARDGEIVL